MEKITDQKYAIMTIEEYQEFQQKFQQLQDHDEGTDHQTSMV
jgi:hypothetical protein